MAASGIVSYGAYIPAFRLDRAAIGQVLQTPAGKGTRAVASYDEDATTLGVEAGRAALAAAGSTVAGAVFFATASPPYLDKTNATAIHAALGLDESAFAVDFAGAARSGIGALLTAADTATPTLAVLSDVRVGLPGGADEATAGDAAAAFLFGSDDPIATITHRAHATAEFLDRWRVPGEVAAHQWEERFGEHAYLPLAEAALTDAFKQAELSPDAVDHFVIAGTHARAVRRVAGTAGVRPEAIIADVGIGNAGTAQVGLCLAAALDRAEPDQTIVVLSLADGADVLVLRTTAALTAYRRRRTGTVAEQAAGGRVVPYATYLTWRGLLDREPPRRPDPTRPAAPPSARRSDWKFAFTGSRCTSCDTRHLPGQRVCLRCQSVDQMVPERVADVSATVTTFVVDRLAFSLNPPVVVAVVDFDGGGRYQCELTDVDPAQVAIGDRVEMTFRRLFTSGGVHNYFWKARPARGIAEA